MDPAGRDVTLDPALRSRLERCATLPTLPAVAVRVLELCQRESLDLAEIAKTISHDPALSAKVLRTVNSSVFGLKQEVRTIAHATALLGANAIRTLALSFSLVQGLRKNDKNVLAGYWKRSIVCAVAAREVAGLVRGVQPDEAFLVGLLEDIGVLALARLHGAEYARIYAQAGGDHQRFFEAERRAFGCDHATVGAWLAARWRLPKPTVTAIGASHEPGSLVHEAGKQHDPERARLAQVAGLAGCLADVWAGGAAVEPVMRLRSEAGHWFTEAVPYLELALARTAGGIQVTGPLFEEDLGTRQEIEEVLERAKEALVAASLRATEEIAAAHSERDNMAARARELELRSATDGLTGLFNRASFDAYLEEQWAVCRRTGSPLSLVLLDVDHFKQINDRYGHVAGDGVLQRLARCLTGTYRTKDRACRYGGEELAVILPDTDSAGARVVAERLREQIAQTAHALGQSPVRVTASVGVATLSVACGTSQSLNVPRELVAAADEALYEAKRAGRNRVAVWGGGVVTGETSRANTSRASA